MGASTCQSKQLTLDQSRIRQVNEHSNIKELARQITPTLQSTVCIQNVHKSTENPLGTFFCKLFIGFICINKVHRAFCVVVRKENFIEARISLVAIEKLNKLSHG